MSIARLIRDMAAAGAPPEAIALAVEAIEAAQQVDANRRAGAAARKRAERARNAEAEKVHAEAVTVAGLSRDSHATVTATTPFPAPAPSFPPNPQTNPTPTHTPENISRARKADFPKPDWADAQVWADFLANRKAKRLPNTATAHKRFLADVERLTDGEWPPGRLLEYAVARGWGAIFDPRNRNGHHVEPRNNRNTQEPTDSMVRAAARFQAGGSDRELQRARGSSGDWP